LPSELEKTRAEIKILRNNLDQLRSRARSAQDQLTATELQVELTLRELTLAEQTQRQVQAQSEGITRETRELVERITKEKRQIGERLRQLYKLGGLSYVRILMSIDRKQNPFEAISMLSYLVGRDSRQIQRFQTHQDELAAMREQLAQQNARVALSVAEVAERRVAVERARVEQQRLVQSLNLQSAESAQRLANLEEKARRLERLFALLYEQSRSGPTGGVTSYRGSLPWPVQGAVVQEFGKHRSEKFATYTVSNGLRVAATPGTEAHAVFAGRVLYSQWFKGYGNLIIVDHGDRIFSLYGNTRIGLVKVGDQVKAGQPIATVNEGEGDEGGYLYFEIRENNRPVNPRSWLRP
jgi:septal ring factor EnvC (AmiA/AmiB activator)